MKHAAYALLALCLLAYGAAVFEPAAGWGWQNAFAGLWLVLALLAAAAHIQRLLIDEATAARLVRIRRERITALERRLMAVIRADQLDRD